MKLARCMPPPEHPGGWAASLEGQIRGLLAQAFFFTKCPTTVVVLVVVVVLVEVSEGLDECITTKLLFLGSGTCTQGSWVAWARNCIVELIHPAPPSNRHSDT